MDTSKIPGQLRHKTPNSYATPQSKETLGKQITKSLYDRAVNRAPPGKAPGPDAITNELVKHLPEDVHTGTLVYTLFQTMAKHNYTPKERCRSATSLFYKPNKKDLHIIAYYMPIALMNGILKLWNSILTNIGSPWVEAQDILSDTVNGFRRHKKIHDILSRHIVMYEDAKISKIHIYTAYSVLKGAFGGMDQHRILFKTTINIGFPE